MCSTEGSCWYAEFEFEFLCCLTMPGVSKDIWHHTWQPYLHHFGMQTTKLENVTV